MSVRTCVATAHHGLGDDWMTMEWGLLRGIRGWAGYWWWLGCLLVAMINYDHHDLIMIMIIRSVVMIVLSWHGDRPLDGRYRRGLCLGSGWSGSWGSSGSSGSSS